MQKVKYTGMSLESDLITLRMSGPTAIVKKMIFWNVVTNPFNLPARNPHIVTMK
jgi:hypothetical protein